MRYQIQQIEKEAGQFYDAKKQEWPYLNKKEYRKLPEKERRICADLRKRDSKSMERILSADGREIGLYEYRASKRWNDKVVGYIPVRFETEERGQRENLSCVRIVDRSWVKSILFPLAVLLLLAGIVMGIFWYVNKDKIPGLDKTTVAYEPKGLENKDPDKISFPGMQTIFIEKGDPHVEQILLNPKGNPCYFIFRIRLADTGELLYESGLVEPGHAVMEFDMERGLDTGEYDAMLEIETRDLENYENRLNGGNINIKLNVG